MTPGRRRGRIIDPARLLAGWLIRRADRANRVADWQRAERLYAWALTIRPDLPAIHVQHGHALKQQGLPHRALAAYRTAAALAGGSVDPWVQLGHALELLERPHEAAAAFAAALAIDPRAAAPRRDDARGPDAGTVPSAAHHGLALLLERHDLAPAVVTLLDSAFYGTHDTALAGADAAALLDHFGRVGLDRLLPLNPRANFDADHYRRTYPDASRLDAPHAYRHWLTFGVRLGRAADAAAARASAAPPRAGADRRIWTGRDFAAMAAGQEAARDWLGALATLAEGSRALSADADLRQRLAVTADRAIHVAWDQAMDGGQTLDVARAGLRAVVRAAIAAMTPDADALPAQPIRALALVGNLDLPQCRLYRVDQKREQLVAAGFAVDVFDETRDVPRFLAQMIRFQAVIFYRVPAHAHVVEAMLAARVLGLVTFYEIDDLLFDDAHYPAPIETYAPGFSPTAHRGLALATVMYAEAMALCDHGLASTPTLAAAMRPHVRSRQAFVHPNVLGSAHLAHAHLPPVPRAGPVTILCGSHTQAHKADVETLVEPALAQILGRHGPGVSIVFVGAGPRSGALQTLGSRITILAPMPLDAYWALLRTVDIVVAPLVRSPATDAKSAVKWLEAAMLGVPAVVSRTATMNAAIEDGVTGFLCDTAADWSAVLDRLVGDPSLRHDVGERARAAAFGRFAPDAAAVALAGIVAAVSPPPAPKRRRIVIVNVFYPPQSFGGATRVVHDNVRDLRARHADTFHIEVFATLSVGGPPGRVRSAVHEGVRVTTVSTPAGDERDMEAEDPVMAAAFGAFLDATQPDLVHFHAIQRLTGSVVGAASARRIPTVVTAHDGWWIASRQFLLDDRHPAQRYDYAAPLRTLDREGHAAFARLLTFSPWLAGAEAVLAVSAAAAGVLAESHVPHLRIVANGVSPVSGTPRRANLGGPIRLGYLGGLYTHKGWGLIEDALRGFDAAAFSLLVVDHGMAPAERRTEQWGATVVTYRGKCSPGDVAELYADIDILLAPSLWPESFGLVTREALSCGCWVIASDRGAIADDVQQDVNGFVVDVGSPNGLQAALRRVADEPDRFRQPPPPCRLRTAQDQADDLARLYAAILDAAASR